MPRTPFFPTFAQLPETLPIFPLAGAVAMPGSDLPLNIFEPRYLNMVQDALRGHRIVGMIQPDPAQHGDPPPVYGTGCAGRITSFTETVDGRIELVLTGVCRFDVAGELPTTRGYRLVKADWQRFAGDLRAAVGPAMRDDPSFRDAVRQYFESSDLSTDWAQLERMPVQRVASILVTLLPLSPALKQSILETVEDSGRRQKLLAGLELAVRGSGRGQHPH